MTLGLFFLVSLIYSIVSFVLLMLTTGGWSVFIVGAYGVIVFGLFILVSLFISIFLNRKGVRYVSFDSKLIFFYSFISGATLFI